MDRAKIIKLVTDNKIKLDDEIMLVLISNKGEYEYIKAQLRGIDIIREKVTYTELDCSSYIDSIEFDRIEDIRKLDIAKCYYDLNEPETFNKYFDEVNSEILDIITGETDTLEDNVLGKDVVIEFQLANSTKETIKGIIKSVYIDDIVIYDGTISIYYKITVIDEFNKLKTIDSKFIKSFKLGRGED